MIKLNELRVGNYVLDSDVNGLYKISPTDFTLENVWEPITLTPEILEMCGFNKDKYLKYGEYDIEVRKDSVVLWPPDGCTEGHNIQFPCTYLHQLQNLYFALTGEELEIKELANEEK